MLFAGKRRPSLSLFVPSSPNRPSAAAQGPPMPNESLRSIFFDRDTVGLSIIAKESHQERGLISPSRNILLSLVLFRTSEKRSVEVDEDPLGKSSTSADFLGNKTARKRIYMEDDAIEVGDYDAGDSPASSMKRLRETKQGEGGSEPDSTYFLSCCRLCDKNLHGKDIFMYRGYEAFCSPECRGIYMEDEKSEDARGHGYKPSLDAESVASAFLARVAAAS